MTFEQAFQVLGIPADSDEAAITKAYHELSEMYHPDKMGGDGHRQAEINEAHGIARTAATENRALVLTRTAAALNEVKALVLSEQAARKATEQVAIAKRRGVGPLHQLKNMAWLAGGVATVAAFIPDKILPLMPKDQQDLWKPMSGMTTVALIIIGGFFQFRATRLSNQIDAFSDELDDPRGCAQALASILHYEDVDTVQEARIRPSDVLGHSYRNPTELLQRAVHPRFSFEIERERIVQLKSIQHGLLTVMPVEVVTPDSISTFRVNFKPSSFCRKPAEPRSPTTPTSKQEAIWGAFAGAVGFVALLGLTVYLGEFRHSWWAVVAGFFSLGMLGISVEGASNWKMALSKSGDSGALTPE